MPVIRASPSVPNPPPAPRSSPLAFHHPSLTISLYRFTIEALAPMRLPAYKGGVLRGGLGVALKRMVCFQPRTPACEGCPLRIHCPYAYLFETPLPPDAPVLRTYKRIPLPFVLEPPLDDRTVYRPGEHLSFNLVLIGRARNYLPYFIVAFQELGRLGLGKGRTPYRLREVRAVHPLDSAEQVVYRAEEGVVQEIELSVNGEDVNRAALELPAERICIRFLSPTRLKHRGDYVRHGPPFHVLVRALLRRLSSLAVFHGGGRWEADFTGIIERAGKVRLVRSDALWQEWRRYSSRQQQDMDLGGLLGEALYEGELAEFRPLLLWGSLVHVGKATAFGNGKVQVARGKRQVARGE